MKRSIVAVFLLSGCFDPGSAPLNCSADAPACPDSLVCIDGRCVSPIDDLASSSADMASSDLAGDMAGGASGCSAGGGQRIGNAGAWLCPGVYGGVNPKASAACVGRICSCLARRIARRYPPAFSLRRIGDQLQIHSIPRWKPVDLDHFRWLYLDAG